MSHASDDQSPTAASVPSGPAAARATPEAAAATTNPESRRRLRLIIAMAVLVGAILLLIVTEWAALSVLRASSSPSPTPEPVEVTTLLPLPPAAASNSGVTGGPTAVRAFNAPAIPPPLPDGARSPLADRLNAPDRNARSDVAIVAELFANYLEIFRKLPVGTNPEITAALAGDNARALAPLPADHAAINAAGELVDRWGTPYFFHHVSREIMEIRAAGPDRRHFTGDDTVWPEPVEHAAPGALAQAEMR